MMSLRRTACLAGLGLSLAQCHRSEDSKPDGRTTGDATARPPGSDGSTAPDAAVDTVGTASVLQRGHDAFRQATFTQPGLTKSAVAAMQPDTAFNSPALGSDPNIIAFDETTGMPVWTAHVGSGNDGIRGTPVIDPASRRLFVGTGPERTSCTPSPSTMGPRSRREAGPSRFRRPRLRGAA